MLGTASVRAGSHGAQPWPARPVTVIVPLQAGSASDAAVRIVLEQIEVELGQAFVVRNVIGEAARSGAALAAPADGHSFVALNNAIASVQPLLHAPGPVQPERDFVPIGGIATIPTYLGVAASVPARSVAEFIALAQQSRGRLTYAAAGAGSAQHLAAALFMSLTGVTLSRIDYLGATQAAAALAAGAVDSMFISRTLVLPHLVGGMVRLLGFAGRQRSRAFPEIPTLAEQGVTGYDYASWIGLFAPIGTPADAVAALRTTLKRVLARPAVAERLIRAGVEPWPLDPAALAAAIRAEATRWQAVIQRGHLTL